MSKALPIALLVISVIAILGFVVYNANLHQPAGPTAPPPNGYNTSGQQVQPGQPNSSPTNGPSQGPGPQGQPGNGPSQGSGPQCSVGCANQPTLQQATKVTFLNSIYKTLDGSSQTGWFSTGQNASIMLSGFGFNNTGGPLEFNHLAGVATDGTHLVVSDRNNNRVLVWNSIPTSANTPPDIVLGQKTFYSDNPGNDMSGLDWPTQVSIGGGKLVVADSYNNRVLIWNTFPIHNDQPADLEIAGSATTPISSTTAVLWPWGVWTDGTKLAISSTSTARVLVWNHFPTQNNQTPDFYLNASGSLGTPRQITSNGRYLMVGDHNPFLRAGGSQTQPGSFVWDTFPTNNTPYSYFLSAGTYLSPDPNGKPRQGHDWFRGTIMPNGMTVLLADTLYVLRQFPQNNNTVAGITALSFPDNEPFLNLLGIYAGGDGSDVAVAGQKVIAALYNQNKIVIFNSVPNNSFAQPDLVIGASGLFNNSLSEHYFMTNPILLTDGNSLFISSDFDDKMYVYKNLPDQSGAYPNIVYDFNRTFAPWSGAIFNNTLLLTGSKTVAIWKEMPLHGELPDTIFTGSIGNVTFGNLEGTAMDSKYFFLSDTQAGKIYVWNGMPSNTTNPTYVLSTITAPTTLSDDGNFLVVTQTQGGPPGTSGLIWIYNLSNLSANSVPTSLNLQLNLPHDAIVAYGHLFVSDTVHNRVLMWKDINSAIKGARPDEILGCTADPQSSCPPEIGSAKLFWPANLAFDGKHLWVGEFKFSERILRFDIH